MIKYSIQKYIDNKWKPFPRESKYISRLVAEDIYTDLCNKHPEDKYRIVVYAGREIVDIYY